VTFLEGCRLQILISGSDRCLWSNGWSIDTEKFLITYYFKKPCLNATLSLTDPTWTDLISNLRLHSRRPATNCLSYEKLWIINPTDKNRLYLTVRVDITSSIIYRLCLCYLEYRSLSSGMLQYVLWYFQTHTSHYVYNCACWCINTLYQHTIIHFNYCY
jgi:hypothetical protein